MKLTQKEALSAVITGFRGRARDYGLTQLLTTTITVDVKELRVLRSSTRRAVDFGIAMCDDHVRRHRAKKS